MDCAHSEALNTTFSSGRDSIEGFFFYDGLKQGWYKIVKSAFVYTSLNYAFGHRWPRKHHQILEVKKATKKQAMHLMNCSQQEFNELKA